MSYSQKSSLAKQVRILKQRFRKDISISHLASLSSIPSLRELILCYATGQLPPTPPWKAFFFAVGSELGASKLACIWPGDEEFSGFKESKFQCISILSADKEIHFPGFLLNVQGTYSDHVKLVVAFDCHSHPSLLVSGVLLLTQPWRVWPRGKQSSSAPCQPRRETPGNLNAC